MVLVWEIAICWPEISLGIICLHISKPPLKTQSELLTITGEFKRLEWNRLGSSWCVCCRAAAKAFTSSWSRHLSSFPLSLSVSSSPSSSNSTWLSAFRLSDASLCEAGRRSSNVTDTTRDNNSCQDGFWSLYPSHQHLATYILPGVGHRASTIIHPCMALITPYGWVGPLFTT